jgi:hypothetical protein
LTGSGKPPSEVLRLLPRISNDISVVGEAASGAERAIPYDIEKGRAKTVESRTYVLGVAR